MSKLSRAWQYSLVTFDENDKMVLEWWQPDEPRSTARKVTLYTDDMHYIRVWGPDINTEMSDGYLSHYYGFESNEEQFHALMTWLESGVEPASPRSL